MRHALHLPDQIRQELATARPHVYINVGSAALILRHGERLKSLNIASVKKLFRRRNRVVNRLADNRQSGNRHV